MTIIRPTVRGAYPHAAQRLAERYALHLTLIDYAELCDTLDACPRREVIAPAENNRELIATRVHGTRVLAIWCPKKAVILTFFQTGMYVNSTTRERHTRIDQHHRPRHPYQRRGKHRSQ